MFLKMFQIEPRVPVRMLIDTSDSMNSEGGAKFQYARKLAAALCYVGLVRLDTIALRPFGSRLGEGIQCGGGRHRFSPVVEYLSDLKTSGRTNYLEVVRQFISTHPQRGLLVIISDFLDDAGCEKPLQFLADFGHELLLVQIWSEEDRTPPWSGELDLVDAETEARLQLQFDEAARDSYTRAFDTYSAGLQQIAIRNGGRYVGVSTGMPIEDIIFGSLVRSRVMA
jgi:uncharacterized protein (DUF58 family)